MSRRSLKLTVNQIKSVQMWRFTVKAEKRFKLGQKDI